MRRSTASDAHSAVGARRSQAGGAVPVSTLQSRALRRAGLYGTHSRLGGVARAAAISGAGRHVCNVASGPCTKTGTRRESGAGECLGTRAEDLGSRWGRRAGGVSGVDVDRISRDVPREGGTVV